MFKCPLCGSEYTQLPTLYTHIEHKHESSVPKNMQPDQYYYFLKTGKEHGKCIVCGMHTFWNEATGKYKRFCEMKKCKDKYREEFKKRMIGKYGKTSLLDDPEQQKKMLAHRSISGEYKWSDGKKFTYTGSYELDFLKFLDVFMNFSSDDVMAPSPHTYYYLYEGKNHFYIPDFFIPSLNLEIEIKDGGNNSNTHHKIQAVDKVKEKLKDKVLTSQKKYSYIKLTNKVYDPFFQLLNQMKSNYQANGDDMKPIFIIAESLSSVEGEPVLESINIKNDPRKFDEQMLRMYALDEISKSNNSDDLNYALLRSNTLIKALSEIDGNEPYMQKIKGIKTTIEDKLKNLSNDVSSDSECSEVTEDFILHESTSELDIYDKYLKAEPKFNESGVLLEFFFSAESRKVNKAYKYTDRYKFGFLVKNLDLIMKNMIVRGGSNLNGLDRIRPNLLKMVDRCKSERDVNYLRRDLSAGKAMLASIAKRNPSARKSALKHITWMDTTYREALNNKMKEFRSNAVKESFVSSSDEVKNLNHYQFIIDNCTDINEIKKAHKDLTNDIEALLHSEYGINRAYLERLNDYLMTIEIKIESIGESVKESTMSAHPKYVYFAITDEEATKGYINYPKGEYTYKGVNLSVAGLKKFITDYGMTSEVNKYTIIDIDKFNIADNIIPDAEYDMISVKLPFKIKITNVHSLNGKHDFPVARP